MFGDDDGLIGVNEAARVEAYNGNQLVGEWLVHGHDGSGLATVHGEVDGGFDSLVFTAGAYDDAHQFVAGAYANDDGGLMMPELAGGVHGSDFLLNNLLIGIKPAELPA